MSGWGGERKEEEDKVTGGYDVVKDGREKVLRKWESEATPMKGYILLHSTKSK